MITTRANNVLFFSDQWWGPIVKSRGDLACKILLHLWSAVLLISVVIKKPKSRCLVFGAFYNDYQLRIIGILRSIA